jgi:hypothetical protein
VRNPRLRDDRRRGSPCRIRTRAWAETVAIRLGRDRAKNAHAMAAGIALTNPCPDTIDHQIVGIRELLRHDLPIEEPIDDIDTVRRAVNLIKAFDQHWKYRPEGTVGTNRGLMGRRPAPQISPSRVWSRKTPTGARTPPCRCSWTWCSAPGCCGCTACLLRRRIGDGVCLGPDPVRCRSSTTPTPAPPPMST